MVTPTTSPRKLWRIPIFSVAAFLGFHLAGLLGVVSYYMGIENPYGIVSVTLALDVSALFILYRITLKDMIQAILQQGILALPSAFLGVFFFGVVLGGTAFCAILFLALLLGSPFPPP